MVMISSNRAVQGVGMVMASSNRAVQGRGMVMYCSNMVVPPIEEDILDSMGCQLPKGTTNNHALDYPIISPLAPAKFQKC